MAKDPSKLTDWDLVNSFSTELWQYCVNQCLFRELERLERRGDKRVMDNFLKEWSNKHYHELNKITEEYGREILRRLNKVKEE